MLPKIINAIPLSNYRIEVLFDNAEKKVFSVLPYLKYPVYKSLYEIKFFNNVVVKYGTLVWGEEDLIDFDLYTIYHEGQIVELQ